jgi:hypothetical protein
MVLAARRAQARRAPEIRETLEREVATFQRAIGDYSRSNVGDETGMWNGSLALRIRIDPEAMDTGILRDGDNRRNTGIRALSGAGDVDAEFLAHRKQVTSRSGGQSIIGQNGPSGMGTKEMTKKSNRC